MNKLREIILKSDTTAGRNFDLFIQFCIVLSLVSFSLETIKNLSENTIIILNWIELATVTIFTVEYFLRIWLSTHRLSYIFSFFGLIDLIAILPFYMSSGVDLRSIRVLRLMRLFRILKLANYSQALQTFQRAYNHIKAELTVFGVFSILILYISSLGIYIFENEAQPEQFGSIFDALWWSIVTLTTVGYGDAFPITVGGKIFTSLIVTIGLGVIAVPTGLFASALSKTIKEK
jgi:voltage-gated potassium channel